MKTVTAKQVKRLPLGTDVFLDEKEIDAMRHDLELIADYAEALKNVLDNLLEGVQEGIIVNLTLNEIIKRATGKY